MRPRVQRAVAGVLAAVAVCAEATQAGHAAPQPRDTETGRDRRTIIYVDDDNTSGPWDGTVEHPYQYIQDGIDNGAPGDTVFVLAGTYLENVVVDRSVMLLGEDCETTTIDAGGLGEVVYVSADEVTISGFTVTGGSGYGGIDLRSNGNMVSGNHLTENNEVYGGAIYLAASSHNDICDNRITYTDREAIWLNSASCWNTISRNTISNNGFFGVTFWHESTNNTVSENTIVDNRNGIWVVESSHNTFADNTFANNVFDGISVDRSTHLVMTDNAFGAGGGISFYARSSRLEDWNTHEITGNTIDGAPIYYFKDTPEIVVPTDGAQVILANCQGAIVEGLELVSTIAPIQCGYCSDCTISANTIVTDWYGDGIVLANGSNSVVSDNSITSTYPLYHDDPAVWMIGVYVHEGTANHVLHNVVNGFNAGVVLEHHDVSGDNLVSGNSIASELIGVRLVEYSVSAENTVVSGNSFLACKMSGAWLEGWSGVTLVDNTMTGCGVYITGADLTDWNTHILEGNTVNDKPIAYCVDLDGVVVPPSAGQAILANCSNFTVSGLCVADASTAVLGGFCSNGVVSDCSLSGNDMAAIYFQESTAIAIAGNEISGGREGIRLRGGSGHQVVNNRLDGCGGTAAEVVETTDCTIAENTVVHSESLAIRCTRVSDCDILANAIMCGVGTGLTLMQCTGGRIHANVLSSNANDGVVLCYNSMNNTLAHNVFVDNGSNAREYSHSSGNTWSDSSGGNFWSDFADNPGYPDYYEIDGDGDGVDWDPLDSAAGCPFVCGDIDGSCSEVDFADFEAFVECWDLSPDDCGDYGCSDVDGDGAVDLADFATFSLLYGTTPVNTPPDCGGE